MSRKFTIMFVCSGNVCRSPMAEGAMTYLLKNNSIKDVEVISSGTLRGMGIPAAHYAVAAAKTGGVDVSEHKSQTLTKQLIDDSNLIIAMAPDHINEILCLNESAKNKTFLLKNFPNKSHDGEGVADPIGKSLKEYSITFKELMDDLRRIVPDLEKMINDYMKH